MKSGNLNFLEPSGPLKARNGTSLPSPFTLFSDTHTICPRLRPNSKLQSHPTHYVILLKCDHRTKPRRSSLNVPPEVYTSSSLAFPSKHPAVVSVADPKRKVSWMLFPGGTELGTQVKTGSRAGHAHSR